MFLLNLEVNIPSLFCLCNSDILNRTILCFVKDVAHVSWLYNHQIGYHSGRAVLQRCLLRCYTCTLAAMSIKHSLNVLKVLFQFIVLCDYFII